MFGSTSLRLAAIYTAGFAVAVALLGAVTVLTTRSALADQFDNRMLTEMNAIRADYIEGGYKGLILEIGERKGHPGELSFGVQSADGKPLEGTLSAIRAPTGWSTMRQLVDGEMHTLRILTEDLHGGYRLILGDDEARMRILEQSVQRAFGLALAGVILIGAIGGFALSRAMQQRMQAISGTAEAIIDGDLARRVPVSGGDDDLARLAQTINRMLDRIGGLMDSLRQVSSDIAHDLRTPLTRLRQRLELNLRQADDPDRKSEIEGALRDVDAILATFSALLRIAEVEAGARRAAFREVDLTDLVRTVVADFAPAAEDAGQSLGMSKTPPTWIQGDPHLVTQMVVNLVENALRHSPPGAWVQVGIERGGGLVTLTVRDNGPGIPLAERDKVFDRFYRLEQSRSSPGSGLGLALVAAVARLHRAEVHLVDARPGLEVRAAFPAA